MNGLCKCRKQSLQGDTATKSHTHASRHLSGYLRATCGYLAENDRLQAISDYDNWVKNEGISMTMKLYNVIGIK
jgi:hypothetical protein